MKGEWRKGNGGKVKWGREMGDRLKRKGEEGKGN